MAKIIIKADDGSEIKTVSMHHDQIRDNTNVLHTIAGMTQLIFSALDEAFDVDQIMEHEKHLPTRTI